MTDSHTKSALPTDWLQVKSLDLQAQGVAHKACGKVVFIEGALPFEYVSANISRQKNNWEQGTLSKIHRASAQRVQPGCPHFGLHQGACGGCNMQHLHSSAQVAIKQRALEDQLWHLGKVKPAQILRPLTGPTWGYRHRARLSVRFVAKKNTVLIGFHERKSSYVADIQLCPVLPAPVSAMLLPLRQLMLSLDAAQTCPQIEMACSDQVIALVLRHLQPLSAADLARLRAFAGNHPPLQWWLQAKGPETAQRLDAGTELAYSLPEFGIRMPFKPTDFTQVNPHINQALIKQALNALAVASHERVIDWFCGLGNFSLPLATQAAAVLGLEGSAALVERARQNYTQNCQQASLGQKFCATRFERSNLFDIQPETLIGHGKADKWLVDPPREGALALMLALTKLQQLRLGNRDAQPTDHTAHWQPPQRIVYVSCNPATLARDAGLLVHQGGYRCSAAGIIDMFSHTAHVESMAVFDLN